MKNDKFIKQLHELGLTPETYLQCAKILAKKSGYSTAKIDFALDNDHKLSIVSPDGKVVRFGKATYNDYIIWTWLETNGEVPEGTAHERRRLYHARAENINGSWKRDPYSPNNLAIHIIW